jgi:hypothetical protein
MVSSVTSSAQRKLARGVEQVRTLQDEAEAWIDDESYVFWTKHERRAPNELFCRCHAQMRTPLPDHWPLLAGEAIQNFRAALDHSVWWAWRNVKENTGDGDHTQFVICNTPDNFKASVWHLEGVPGHVRTTIERAQPYNRWSQAPELAMLSILREFSNADKHRALAVVATAVDFEMIGVGNRVEIEQWDIATGKPLPIGAAEISSFVARAREGEIHEMDVQPNFTYDVRIEALRLSVLRGIVTEVFEAITEVETGAPPNPFAPYPL